MDIQVRKGMKEGVNYIIVNDKFAKLWTDKY